MSVSSPTSGANTQRDWRSFWQGTGSTRSGVKGLIWATVRLLVAGWLWNSALRLTRFDQPQQIFGVGLALLCVALFFWSLWGFWKGFRTLGIKRLFVTLLLVLILIVALNALAASDDLPLGERFVSELGVTLRQARDSFTSAIRVIFQAPDDFFFAVTRRRAPLPPLPGVPTPDPEATPVQMVISGNSGAAPPLALHVDDTARVVDTGGDALRVRSGPGTSFDVVARFPEGTQVVVIDGPVLADGFKWWKVRTDRDEGWCADQWLLRSQ